MDVKSRKPLNGFKSRRNRLGFVLWKERRGYNVETALEKSCPHAAGSWVDQQALESV